MTNRKPSNYFALLPDELITKIFLMIPQKHKTDIVIPHRDTRYKTDYENIRHFVMIYQNFGYTCSSNYNLIKRLPIPFLEKSIKIPTLEYTAFGCSVKLLKNGSHNLAKLHFIEHGNSVCAFCSSRTINYYHPLLNQEYYSKIGVICDNCQIFGSIKIKKLLEILKINNIFENYEYDFINLKIADKLIKECYNEGIEERCFRLRGISFNEAAVYMTFNKKC